jgi:cystathionine beta-lyase/cystathionine gamma-synthase
MPPGTDAFALEADFMPPDTDAFALEADPADAGPVFAPFDAAFILLGAASLPQRVQKKSSSSMGIPQYIQWRIAISFLS